MAMEFIEEPPGGDEVDVRDKLRKCRVELHAPIMKILKRDGTMITAATLATFITDLMVSLPWAEEQSLTCVDGLLSGIAGDVVRGRKLSKLSGTGTVN